MFVDETSAYVGQSREYGWAASDERVYDSRPKGKKVRVSLVAATSLDGAMAEQALVITDTVNKNAFLCFLETTLLRTLPKGSVIVKVPALEAGMDNWSAKHPEGTVHRLGQNGRYEILPDAARRDGAPERVRDRACLHGDEISELALACGCELLYLPTHSPELSPIEHLFAKIKAFIKSLRPESSDKLTKAFCNAVTAITSEDVLNSFRHCGYLVGQ